ncbi:MAG: hypothetical protein JWP29_2130 [Rhodoferax sp.]|nr:hypothetical protein [Rhodoferax sp.]
MTPSPVHDLPGRLANALRNADPAAQALLLGALLQQALAWHVDASPSDDSGTLDLQLHLSLTPARLACVLHSAPSPESLRTLIGLAAI